MRLSLCKCYQKPSNKSKTVACGLLSAGDGLVCVVFLMCRVWSGEFVVFPFYEQPTLMLISLKFIQQKNSQCNLCQSHPRSPNLYCYGLRAGDVLVYVATAGAGMQWNSRDLSQCQRWALPTRDGHIALSNHSYHSLLLSEPWFPERRSNLIKWAMSSEQIDKIPFWEVCSNKEIEWIKTMSDFEDWTIKILGKP